MPGVKCEVNTCSHWLADGACSAGGIAIYNQNGDTSATSDETVCNTFIRRTPGNASEAMTNVNWQGALSQATTGRTPDPEVECSVDQCNYWTDGDRCSADAIEVTGSHAVESGQTNCETFRPGASGHAD
jgi:hypothetical protein